VTSAAQSDSRRADSPRISVVVPTYNRGPLLRDTIDAILRSRLDGVGAAELIVVDDGSPVPAALGPDATAPGFAVSLLRRTNGGPAAARNTGFRAARGAVVLFVDDDITVPPDLLADHLAAHERLGIAVVCGRCVLKPPSGRRRLFDFLEGLGHDPGRDALEEFVQIHIVASGQISMPRSVFPSEGAYREDLKTPGAEEFELSMRLRTLGVPIFLAPRIQALHCQPVDIDSVSRQQYKHGMGYAEAAVKCPETLALPELATVIRASGPPAPPESAPATAKRLLKSVASSPVVRGGVLAVARWADRLPVPARAQAVLYRAAISSHFVAGVRRGLQLFKATSC
jgi:GT2 family glycosyltransferase